MNYNRAKYKLRTKIVKMIMIMNNKSNSNRLINKQNLSLKISNK